jgi:hypothetical protein
MPSAENFLHTTHRTVSSFNKSHQRQELVLAPPFQRNPVWTTRQKAYLIDSILLGFPVPELYMSDTIDESGNEQHVVVDGQQRIRACLDFINGDYALDSEDVDSRWRDLTFEDLTPELKQVFFGYKFVVRVLPPMSEDQIRGIFARLNRNVVALNAQELRNATYWGPFIQTIQMMADADEFWASSGIFSANDHRRMLDHEFISELVVAYLHGPQNKKDKLDDFYQLYEEFFEGRAHVVSAFSRVIGEISQLLPTLTGTRWRKKSDFYTLFLSLADRVDQIPFAREERRRISKRISELAEEVDALGRLEETEWNDPDPTAAKYTRAVSRAASDKANRIARREAFDSFVFSAGENEGAAVNS